MAFYSGEATWSAGPDLSGNLFEASLAHKDPLSNHIAMTPAISDIKNGIQPTPPDQSPWNLNGNEQYAPLKEDFMPLLDTTTRSVSSISSQVANSQIGISAESPEFSADKGSLQLSRKARGKSLNEREMTLMYTEDALLTEEELAIKKKAQNRLAQRAFRERKELKLKELELLLLQSEEERQQLLDKLNEIKVQFNTLQNENQRLRSYSRGTNSVSEGSTFLFPESQKDFVDEMITDKRHDMSHAQVNKVYEEPQAPGRKVLGVGALWDYLLIKREEEQYENLDLIEVMQLLKGTEVCHGYGPAYPLNVVEDALKCVANRSA